MEIKTERLVLREFCADDWVAVHAYQRDPRYFEFYEWTERTEADVREFLQKFLDQQASEPRRKFQLAVTLRDGGSLIGNAGIRRKDANEFEADIGYEISHERWRKGYATEAARALVAHGFETMRLHRISAMCNAENAASVRVLEKTGMRQEGRLRDSVFFKERYWDALQYAILEFEYMRS